MGKRHSSFVQSISDKEKSVSKSRQQESLQLLFGHPVSRNFVPMWMCLVSERIRRVIKIHPEFQSLSSYDQVPML
jgi:hypothetical protein